MMETAFIGVSKEIQAIRELIKHVSDTGLNIVVTGETGVGKEVVARSLYETSPRRDNAFIKVNCAALPDGLLESELYGYERGAFTGADRKKQGKFALANGGVLFLDEIGDMSLPLQAKLLHVLQSGEFAPLGAEKETKTDTWVIAATNHDLGQEITEGKFREDLYYRLNIIKICIPPLRERHEDIPLLINHFVDTYTQQFSHKEVSLPTRAVIERLSAYHWPGNVRQLQNTIKGMLVLGNWDRVIDELPTGNGVAPAAVTSPVPGQLPPVSDLLDLNGEDSPSLSTFSLKTIRKRALDRIEREVISHVLGQTGWNRSKAAKILKISYKTLLYKITDLELAPPRTLGL